MPKPNYKLIDELERELYPEWFEGDEPTPPPTPPPPRSRRAPGREEEFRIGPDSVWPMGVSAVAVMPNEMPHWYAGPPLRRAKIYDRHGRPL